MRTHLTRPFFFIASCAVAASAFAQPGSLVRDSQSALSEWIAVEKQLAAERGDWIEQKEVILSSIDFMRQEIERLDEIIATAQETASAGERKRAEIQEKRAALDAASNSMAEAVADYERQILSLATTWPKAFLDTVGPVVKRIPSDPKAAEAAPLTVRLQNIVAILTQFDKFQSGIAKDTGVQEVEGVSREVTTLYYGFAYAYFVDSSGDYAGYGYPQENGWAWVADPSMAPAVSRLVSIYDRSAEAAFVGLPARIVTP